MHYWDIYTFFNQYFYCFLRIIFRFFYLHKTYICCKDIYTFFNQCFYHFWCIIFRFFYSTMIDCLFSQANLLFLCVFKNILSVFCFLLILAIIINHLVLFLFMLILSLTKILIVFEVIITPLQMIYGYFFQIQKSLV